MRVGGPCTPVPYSPLLERVWCPTPRGSPPSSATWPQSRVARVAVVTGGASGIGRATAERLHAAGWAVVVADVNEERGAELAREGVSFVSADVSREEDVAGAIAHAVQTFGRLDCMVDNAGVGGAFGPLTETPRRRLGLHVRRRRPGRLPGDEARRRAP